MSLVKQHTCSLTLRRLSVTIFLQWKGTKYHIFQVCVCVCSLNYQGCKTHAPYWYLWLVWLFHIFFSILSHKRHNFHWRRIEHKICFDVMLTVHLSIFISVFNQLDAQNLFHNKFYFMPQHVSSACAHHQEVKTALHSLWYHHTFRFDDTRGCVMQFWPPDDEHVVLETCRGMK